MKLALVKKKSCIEVHNTKSNNPICALLSQNQAPGETRALAPWPHVQHLPICQGGLADLREVRIHLELRSTTAQSVCLFLKTKLTFPTLWVPWLENHSGFYHREPNGSSISDRCLFGGHRLRLREGQEVRKASDHSGWDELTISWRNNLDTDSETGISFLMLVACSNFLYKIKTESLIGTPNLIWQWCFDSLAFLLLL